MRGLYSPITTIAELEWQFEGDRHHDSCSFGNCSSQCGGAKSYSVGGCDTGKVMLYCGCAFVLWTVGILVLVCALLSILLMLLIMLWMYQSRWRSVCASVYIILMLLRMVWAWP